MSTHPLRYSDWFSGYPRPKLEKVKIFETCCVNGRYGKNILNIKISRYRFVCHYPPNVFTKFYGNPSNLHTLLIRSKSTYSVQNEVRVLSWERFETTHAFSGDYNTSSHCETMKRRTSWRQLQRKRISRQKNRITVTPAVEVGIIAKYKRKQQGKPKHNESK